jgi:NADP-dependent 3-hydroxy acid dehydrogenase YdfG
MPQLRQFDGVLLIKRFADQVVFLTGASSGIGEALAKVFADEGAKLVLLARRDDRLQLLAKALETGGKETLVQKCDVTRDGDLEKAAEAARQRFGRIDVVVANAGFGIIGKLEKLSLEDYRRQFETNVFGVLRTVQAVWF